MWTGEKKQGKKLEKQEKEEVHQQHQQQSAKILPAVVEPVLSSGEDLVLVTGHRTKERLQGLNESFSYQAGI